MLLPASLSGGAADSRVGDELGDFSWSPKIWATVATEQKTSWPSRVQRTTVEDRCQEWTDHGQTERKMMIGAQVSAHSTTQPKVGSQSGLSAYELQDVQRYGGGGRIRTACRPGEPTMGGAPMKLGWDADGIAIGRRCCECELAA